MKAHFSFLLALSLLHLASPAHAAPPAPPATQDPAGEIDRLLAATFHPDAPGAVVLVIDHGQPLLRRAYGMANLELHLSMDPSAVLRICSLTKQFTAVAILQLADAGKLRLDDPLAAYLPAIAPPGVTIAQLLTHTSGVPSLDPQRWMKIWTQDLTPLEVVALTRDKPLDFPPGTDFRYSNSGYVLLGALIEKCSGQTYPDYLQSHIFTPANMSSSFYDSASRIIPHRVPGYILQEKAWANAPAISMTQTYSAGALLSTVDDLYIWERALSTGKLLSPSLLARASSHLQLPDGRDTNYGFGWELSSIAGHPSRAHGGGIPGYSAYELRIPDIDFYAVLLSNTNETPLPLRTLALRIARIALHQPASPAAFQFPASELQDFPGNYRITPTQSFIVTLDNGSLIAQLGPGKKKLLPTAPDSFTTADEKMQFQFLRDPAHHVDRLQVQTDGPGPFLIWPRTTAAIQNN
jgi:CubicO group peptidase (beta-lactamase class C family)